MASLGYPLCMGLHAMVQARLDGSCSLHYLHAHHVQGPPDVGGLQAAFGQACLGGGAVCRMIRQLGEDFQAFFWDSSSQQRQAASLRLPLPGTLSAGWRSIAVRPRQWLRLMCTSVPRSKPLVHFMPCAAGLASWACTKSLALLQTLRASRAW